MKSSKSPSTEQTPVAVNTHGLTPPVQTMRLFDLDGWRMLVEVDSNDAETVGVGIRCTVHTNGAKVTMWSGSPTYSDELNTLYSQRVQNMTNSEASKRLSNLLKIAKERVIHLCHDQN